MIITSTVFRAKNRKVLLGLGPCMCNGLLPQSAPTFTAMAP